MDTYQQKNSFLKGFTLVELLITIAIASMVATIGMPSFTQTIRNSRLTTNANELVTSLSFARSEAVKRNQTITIRRAGTEWESGWTVFVDLDGDGNGIPEGDTTDTVLRVYAGLPDNYTLRSTGINRVTFQASGISGNGSFVLCENSDGNNIPEANTSKVVIINSVGRVRMGIDADDDGIPEKDGGELASCIISPFT